MRLLLLLAASCFVTLAWFGGGPVEAGDESVTFCYERPMTFDPLFRPAGCFTYSPVEGGMVFVGRALVDSGFADRGSVVEAHIGDSECGSTTVQAPNGLFILPVQPDASRQGCGAKGERIEFLVNGTPARQSLLWHENQGANPELFSLTALTNTSWFWFERLTRPAPRIGILVETFMDGVLCGQTTIGGEGEALPGRVREGMRGFLRLAIVQNGGPCGQVGAPVTFRVGGLRGETVVRWAANAQRIDLLVQGDASCDLLVDARDATLVLQYAAGLAGSLPCHGDADHSGHVDAFDAQHVLQFSAGLTSELPE